MSNRHKVILNSPEEDDDGCFVLSVFRYKGIVYNPVFTASCLVLSAHSALLFCNIHGAFAVSHCGCFNISPAIILFLSCTFPRDRQPSSLLLMHIFREIHIQFDTPMFLPSHAKMMKVVMVTVKQLNV